MDLESDIKHLEREKLRQTILVPAKTAVAIYAGFQIKNGINHYNNNSEAYTKLLNPNLEDQLNDLYLTKGMLWLDKKVSGWVNTIKKEPVQKTLAIPQTYADTAPLLVGTLGLILAVNTARKRIRENKRLSIILKAINRLQ